MKRFDIRIERPGDFEDVIVHGMDLSDCRRRVQGIMREYLDWNWRGQVVFVNGAKPAEEHERVLERWKKRA